LISPAWPGDLIGAVGTPGRDADCGMGGVVGFAAEPGPWALGFAGMFGL